MKVTVFGIGYVGLVHAAILAETGNEVVCVDIDPTKIERLRNNEIPLFEPGLEPIVVENQAAGRLFFTTDPAVGVAHGEIQFIAVGTPSEEDGSADLSYVLKVADTIAVHLTRGETVVVVKSTVPVGTSEKVRQTLSAGLAAKNANLSFSVVSNPEFLREGSAVSDSLRPDRIILGTHDPVAEERLRELYAPFNRNHEKIIVMDVRSAELTKYVANCMLATKISFMNEMAVLADSLDADIESVRRGIGSDPRIGYHFIYAGMGFGGSCFPKDVRALIRTARDNDMAPSVLEAVQSRNVSQKNVLVDRIKSRFGEDLRNRTFAIWGLAFKPDTDDMREAPARVLMEALWDAGATVRAYDPVAMVECARLYGARDDLVLTPTKEDALAGADALVVCTEWKNFRAPDFDVIRSTLRGPVVFDGRNIYDPAVMARHELEYFGIGRRGKVPAKPAQPLT